jgi:hypothetical protein
VWCHMRRMWLITAAFLGACAHADTAAPDDQAALTTGQSPARVQLTDNWSRWRQDAYEFSEMQLNGDRLSVTVRHGGGCRNHEFALLVNPAFLESYPVQMGGVLAHDAKGDPCRALLQKTLEFDLTPVKEAYQRAYQTRTGTINLRVRGWPQVVQYTF